MDSALECKTNFENFQMKVYIQLMLGDLQLSYFFLISSFSNSRLLLNYMQKVQEVFFQTKSLFHNHQDHKQKHRVHLLQIRLFL